MKELDFGEMRQVSGGGGGRVDPGGANNIFGDGTPMTFGGIRGDSGGASGSFRSGDLMPLGGIRGDSGGANN